MRRFLFIAFTAQLAACDLLAYDLLGDPAAEDGPGDAGTAGERPWDVGFEPPWDAGFEPSPDAGHLADAFVPDSGAPDAGSQPGVERLADAVNAGGLAVDDLFVYWTESGGRVRRVRKTGGQVVDIAVNQADPRGVAADGSDVYWVNAGREAEGYLGASLSRVTREGGEQPVELVPQQAQASFVYVDGEEVLWQYGGSTGGVGRLIKRDGMRTIVRSGWVKALAADFGHVYTALDGGAIERVNRDGTRPIRIAGPPETVEPAGIAVWNGIVFWTDRGIGTVKRVAGGGGTIETISTGHMYPKAIAADDTGVYFASAEGRIHWANHDGSNTQLIAERQSSPGFIALDATHVYWATSYEGGAISRAWKVSE